MTKKNCFRPSQTRRQVTAYDYEFFTTSRSTTQCRPWQRVGCCVLLLGMSFWSLGVTFSCYAMKVMFGCGSFSMEWSPLWAACVWVSSDVPLHPQNQFLFSLAYCTRSAIDWPLLKKHWQPYSYEDDDDDMHIILMHLKCRSTNCNSTTIINSHKKYEMTGKVTMKSANGSLTGRVTLANERSIQNKWYKIGIVFNMEGDIVRS